MSSIKQRSQSVPLPGNSSIVKDSRVLKPRGSDFLGCSGRYNSKRSWSDFLSDSDQHEGNQSSTRCNTSSRDSIGPVTNPQAPADSAPDPERLSSFLETGRSLEILLTITSDTDIDVQPALIMVRKLYQLGIDKGRIPCLIPECLLPCKHYHRRISPSLREEQANRKTILERAAKDLSSSKIGKPWTSQRVLAAYGRREIALGGQMAASHEMDKERACEECKKAGWICVWVKRDEFWKRSQCVGCVQRKISCSLDRAKWTGEDSLG